MLGRIRLLSERAVKAIVFCTHILPDVQRICDAVIILAKGRVRLTDRLETLNRPRSPSVELQVLGATTELVQRIRGEGYAVGMSTDDAIIVEDPRGDITNHIWRWARQCDVGIRSVSPARNSLEDVFLNAIQEGNDADL